MSSSILGRGNIGRKVPARRGAVNAGRLGDTRRKRKKEEVTDEMLLLLAAGMACYDLLKKSCSANENRNEKKGRPFSCGLSQHALW